MFLSSVVGHVKRNVGHLRTFFVSQHAVAFVVELVGKS